MKKHKLYMQIVAAIVAGSTSAFAGNIEVDSTMGTYQKTEGVSGNLNSIGSDTLNNLMALWTEAFRKSYPNVNIQVEGKGSSTAPPALIEGTSQLAPMSREMKREELDAFEAKYGFPPTKIGVALDSLAVYVHKDNPVEGLTMPQVDAIFSKTRKKGHENDIATWGAVGLEGDWSNLPISLYGRNSASGTYGFFKEEALAKGDFKDSVKEQPGSASVVQGVTEDKAGIGYSGIGYRTSGVKPLKLASGTGEEAYEPTYENVLEGKYPLSRMLYVYVVRKPGEPMDVTVKEFLKLILSKEGQEVVVKDGYMPLTTEMVNEQLGLLE